MSVEIPLMPKHSLGFYLQLAAVGVGGLKNRLTQDLEALVFKSSREYADAIKGLLVALARAFVGREEVDLCEICEKLREREGKEGPKLYEAGRKDRKILEEAGLVSRRCAEGISWCSAALSYAEKVMKVGGPIGGRAPLVMLARALVYGRLRDTMAEVGVEDVQVDSLGITLLGGLFSLISTIKVERKTFELYLLPDGSPESLDIANTVYEAFHSGKLQGRSFSDILTDLVELERGLTIDLATYVATLTHLSMTMKTMTGVSGLATREGFERFLLARVESSGNRPQLVWMGPLTVSRVLIAIKGREKVLENLWYLARTSHQLRRRKSKEERDVGERLASATSKCFNNAALYMWTGSRDLLLECSRELSEVIDDLRSLDREAYRYAEESLRVVPILARGV